MPERQTKSSRFEGAPAQPARPPSPGDGGPKQRVMKKRLDLVVAERTGLSRAQARGLILAGRVHVEGSPHTKPGAGVPASAAVVVEETARYVSRGGEKLEGALET